MELEDITDNNMFNKNNIINDQLGFEIKMRYINGYIYRGDKHDMDMLADMPKFFGSKKSAILYAKQRERGILKKYKTKGKLRILNVTASDNNIDRIKKLLEFIQTKLPNRKLDLKILWIFLQIAFGLIHDDMSNIDMCGLELKDVVDYLNKRGEKYKQDTTISFLNKEMKEFLGKKDSGVEPSRFSLSTMDKFVVRDLAGYLRYLSFDGLFYVHNKSYNNEKVLCRVINRTYYDDGKSGETCVPTEICIFNPKKSLELVSKIPVSEIKEGRYEEKYKKYKNKCTILKNKIYP